MNEENKEDKEKSPQPSEEETKEEKPEESEADAKETEEDPRENIDYKRILEEEKAKKKEWRDKFFKEKKARDEEEESLESEEIEEKIEEKVKLHVASLQRNLQENNAKQMAQVIAGSSDEAELILYHYKNTITPSDDLEKDMRRCKLLANEGRIDKQFSEIRRSIDARERRGKSSGSGQKLPQKEEKPELSEADKKVLNKIGSGVQWDPKIKTYVRWDKKSNQWIGPDGQKGTLPPLKGH